MSPQNFAGRAWSGPAKKRVEGGVVGAIRPPRRPGRRSTPPLATADGNGSTSAARRLLTSSTAVVRNGVADKIPRCRPSGYTNEG
jgi:hypothetical protein